MHGRKDSSVVELANRLLKERYQDVERFLELVRQGRGMEADTEQAYGSMMYVLNEGRGERGTLSFDDCCELLDCDSELLRHSLVGRVLYLMTPEAENLLPAGFMDHVREVDQILEGRRKITLDVWELRLEQSVEWE